MKWYVVLASVLPLAAQSFDPAHCAALRHHGDPDASKCYQQLTKSPDPGVRAEGYWGARNYTRANEEFRAAVKAHDKDPYLRVRWGRMYLEHWQPVDAKGLFTEALQIKEDYAPALLGMALVSADGFEAKAAELAHAALKSDPKLVEAQELLARVALEDNNSEKAEAEAKQALTMSSEALDAMAILATIDWLNDKTTTPWIDKILKINPMYGEAYEIAGHFFVINRRYEEGIKSYRKAIEIEPTLNSARSQLAINLMRLGREQEARNSSRRVLGQRLSEHRNQKFAHPSRQLQEFRHLRNPDYHSSPPQEGSRASPPLLRIRASARHRHLREKVQVQTRRARASRGLSRSRRFRRPHHGDARPGRARRHLRHRRRDGFP